MVIETLYLTKLKFTDFKLIYPNKIFRK